MVTDEYEKHQNICLYKAFPSTSTIILSRSYSAASLNEYPFTDTRISILLGVLANRDCDQGQGTRLGRLMNGWESSNSIVVSDS
jgi:hypothetical protein